MGKLKTAGVFNRKVYKQIDHIEKIRLRNFETFSMKFRWRKPGVKPLYRIEDLKIIGQ